MSMTASSSIEVLLTFGANIQYIRAVLCIISCLGASLISMHYTAVKLLLWKPKISRF